MKERQKGEEGVVTDLPLPQLPAASLSDLSFSISAFSNFADP